ncbi:MAG: HAMP domain-containing histidine kinase [Firmicutes bacterium]|nr:HAMP domain-containing histidine kinase [Bacillota bacterium]
MDTKWKRSKSVLSFIAFCLGISLLIGSAFSTCQLMFSGDREVLKGSGDYQQSAYFRDYVSERLASFLGVATGGESTKYGTYGVGNDYGDKPWWWYDSDYYEDGIGYVAYGYDENYDYYDEAYESYYEESSKDNKFDVKTYMAEKAANKNLRYAVIYKGKLLYTNIEGYENKVGQAWNGEDVGKSLSEEEYNFTLWFNKKGDGKVEIVKDGKAEDVYGDGVYTRESRWYVPGYTNFNADLSTKEAVIFMAVAKTPKLYVAGNYGSYGPVTYGRILYNMEKSFEAQQNQFLLNMAMIGLSIALLIFAWFWRKEKRQANQYIAGLIQKIWLELKILILLVVVCMSGRYISWGNLREWIDIIRYEEAIYWGDFFTYGLQLQSISPWFFVIVFWVIYLVSLEIRYNRGKQKKLILGTLGTKGFTYSVQKTLIKRYRVILVTAGLALLLCLLSFIMIRDVMMDYYGDGSLFQWIILLVAGILAFYLIAGIANLRRNRQLAVDMGLLAKQIVRIKEGDLTNRLDFPEDGDLRQAAENLNEIQHGLEKALEQQMHSERLKVDLVTNVSHDIKTPLTSIISYVDLLKQEEQLPEHVKEFIQILGEKSERLRNIVQDVFEVSKATSGQLSVEPETLDLAKLLRQTLADMNNQLEESGLTIKTSMPEEPVYICADGQRLYRVFQNLIQNALKYSMEGTRIFLLIREEQNQIAVYVKNTSAVELAEGVDFTERFARGDVSRSDGGSGLGLSIAKSFTEACGGSFHIEVDADLFTAKVAFPTVEEI